MALHISLCFLALVTPYVSAESVGASVEDLRRAATRVPRASYRGSTFTDMSGVLNRHLRKASGLSTADCSSFTSKVLQETVLEPIFHAAHPELLAIYTLHGDRRQRAHASLDSLRTEWATADVRVGDRRELQEIQRDGLCHEAVMWFVHHLTEEQKREVQKVITLPLLPLHLHHDTDAQASDSDKVAVHADYASKVSCQQCHTGPIGFISPDATLPPPLPVDATHPGRERLRSCDFQNKPPCGPCDGLGGPRWGDGVEQFTPLNCTVIAAASDVPEGNRTRAAYPHMGHASIHGDTRSPLAVRPDPKKPGKYPVTNATIDLAWDDKMLRHRYDFQNMLLGRPVSQIYLQTREQVHDGNNSGAMVTILGREGGLSACICTKAVAGIMHVDAFVPHDKLDPLDLPSDEGGLAYLGRIQLNPIDDVSQPTRVVVADHYMKWAFHFLVDADPASPGYGLPLRLYGNGGVRMVYSDWKLGDPREQDPGLFTLPSHCLALTAFCRELKKESVAAEAQGSTQFV